METTYYKVIQGLYRGYVGMVEMKWKLLFSVQGLGFAGAPSYLLSLTCFYALHFTACHAVRCLSRCSRPAPVE